MKKRPLCLVCVGLMIAIWMMKQAGVPIFGEPALPSELEEKLQDGMTAHVTGTITGRQEKPNSIQYILDYSFLIIQETKIPIHKIICTTEKKHRYAVGDQIEAAGIMKALRTPGNPGEFDSRAYYACRKIYHTMWADGIVLHKQSDMPLGELMLSFREQMTGNLQKLLPPEVCGVLAAMVWGEREFLSEESRTDYQLGGISHVLSISGLHITLLGMGLFQLLMRLRLPGWSAAIVAAACMGLYCVMVGGRASAVRACVMFCIMVCGRIWGRSYDLLCSLAAAGILILLGNPGYLFDSGFQLSFSAVLGAGVVYPILGSFRFPKDKKKRTIPYKLTEKMMGAGLLWFSVNLCTMPLICFYFYEIPVYSLFTNVLLVPLMGVVLLSGLAGSLAAWGSELLGKLVLAPAVICLTGVEKVTNFIGALPKASWICGQPQMWQVIGFYLGMGVGIWRIKKGTESQENKRRGIIGLVILGAASFLLFWRPPQGVSITALDVGQGDCLAVTAGQGICFLVDGGSSDVKQVGTYRILPYLKQQGIHTLEGIFITHSDLDHVNGIQEILRAIADGKTCLKVNRLFLPDWMRGKEEEKAWLNDAIQAGVEVAYLSKGDKVAKGGLTIEVLHPKRGNKYEGNEGSLVMRLTQGAFSGLLTGDLEGGGERAVLEEAGKCAFLKIAHHGSRNSSSQAFLEKVSPAVCVISAPEHSVYGHPHSEVLERMESVGAEWYQTGKSGAVRLEIYAGEMKVRTFRTQRRRLHLEGN